MVMKIAAAAGVATLLSFATATASHATSEPSPLTTPTEAGNATPGVVIAFDSSSALQAIPSASRTVEIVAGPRDVLRLKTQGKKSRTVRADAEGYATVKNLVAGRTYTISTSDASTTVVPVVFVGRATSLSVTTTRMHKSVALTWRHRATRARGGSDITYRVVAEPLVDDPEALIDFSAATLDEEVSTNTATLTGLDPQLRYRFSVTPQNSLGSGRPTVAVMQDSLGSILGLSVPGETQIPLEPKNPQGEKTAPAAAPLTPPGPPARQAPAPTSSTRTISVCPEGFSDDNGVCTRKMAYTYEIQDYTYHRAKVGTETYVDRCASGYTDAEGNFHWIEQPHDCTQTRDVYGDVLDPTPAGWEDTRTHWQKKDDTPEGWADDGHQWVQTTGKITKVVPA